METPPDLPTRLAPDSLDALLASRPVRPSSDFTEKTLARIAAERDAESDDGALDVLIASRPLAAPDGLGDRVVAEVATLRRRRFVLFRVVTPVALAACLALAVAPALFVGNGRSGADRVAATLAADSELNALATLPVAKNNTLHSDDLAALAALGAGFADQAQDSAYEI